MKTFPKAAFLKLLSLTLCLSTIPLFAEVWVPAIFDHHMVLQQKSPIPVWGRAAAGEKIEVTLGTEKVRTLAGADGKWKVMLKPRAADGKALTLTIRGQNTLRFDDVLMGEVWLGSGQSNMEWLVRGSSNAAAEIAKAIHPNLRLFTVGKKTSALPLENVSGTWAVGTPSNVGAFSAVLYFFGREVHQRLSVPVGLIHTSWGGTPAEAWMGTPALSREPEWAYFLERYTNDLLRANSNMSLAAKVLAYSNALKIYHSKSRVADPGISEAAKDFANPDLDDKNWRDIASGVMFQDAWMTNANGAMWYRQTIHVPAEWEGKELSLNLGVIDDYDQTFWNGVKVGATGPETASWWTVRRSYVIPKELVKAGKVVVAVRVMDDFGKGGLMGSGDDLVVAPKDGTASALHLASTWKGRLEFTAPVVALPPPPQDPRRPQVLPAALWNGMVAPLVPFAAKGVVWYQGENNAGRAFQYRKLFKGMISWWREAWGRDLSFYFVQLANYQARAEKPAESDWAELREAQLLALALPRTGMAVTADIGQGENIHPTNKIDVGHRLALHALSKDYGLKVSATGPLLKSSAVKGSAVHLEFSNVEGKLLLRLPSAPTANTSGFQICGADTNWVWASAAVSGKTGLDISSPAVAKPLYVRYGWATNPLITLYDDGSLPATPFRTDPFPNVTEGRK